jgi:hypothetical protein
MAFGMQRRVSEGPIRAGSGWRTRAQLPLQRSEEILCSRCTAVETSNGAKETGAESRGHHGRIECRVVGTVERHRTERSMPLRQWAQGEAVLLVPAAVANPRITGKNRPGRYGSVMGPGALLFINQDRPAIRSITGTSNATANLSSVSNEG